MKKIFFSISLCILAASYSKAQVTIGKTSANGTSTLLDFYDSADNFRGIILPALDTSPNVLTPSNNGTFILDKSDKKIKMYENNVWKDLSAEGNITNLKINTSNENTEKNGVIIGSINSSAKGVLVLESSDKALILPKIANPHTTVRSPYPGMMCYDTVAKAIAVFDGSLWNYWR